MDALAPLLLRQEKDHGNLILVTDDATTGAFISERYFHQVNRQDKLACLVTIKQQPVASPLSEDKKPKELRMSKHEMYIPNTIRINTFIHPITREQMIEII